MGFKQNNSPLKQSLIGSMVGNIADQVNPAQAAAVNAQQQQQLNSGSIATGMPGVVSGIQNQISRADNIVSPNNPIVAGPGNFTSNLSRSITPRTNMNIRPQTPISPKAFSNQGTIANMYGQAVQGTFNRSLGSPLMQTVDPLTGQTIDPTMDQSADMPLPPPVGVQVPITPTYDINQ